MLLHEALKVFLDEDGDWALPLTATYTDAMAEAVGHTDALADALDAVAEQLIEAANALRVGDLEVEFDEQIPLDTDDYS